jgi:hypothetical protein
MFKITMKSKVEVALGPLNTINPSTKIWRIILILSFYLQCFKVCEMGANCHDSSVGFSGRWRGICNLNFIKTRICNQLTKNLTLFACIFGLSFSTMHNFLYDEAMGTW